MKCLLACRLSLLPNISCSPSVHGLMAGETVVFKRASICDTLIHGYDAIPIILNVKN